MRARAGAQGEAGRRGNCMRGWLRAHRRETCNTIGDQDFQRPAAHSAAAGADDQPAASSPGPSSDTGGRGSGTESK